MTPSMSPLPNALVMVSIVCWIRSVWLMPFGRGRRPKCDRQSATTLSNSPVLARLLGVPASEPAYTSAGEDDAKPEIPVPPPERTQSGPKARPATTLSCGDAADVRRFQRVEGEVQGQHRRHGGQAQAGR